MSLHAIAYASEARADLRQPIFDRLLADATAFNRVAGVTGVLMFDGSRFLQYLEGPQDGIDCVPAHPQRAQPGQLHVRAAGAAGISRAGRWVRGASSQNHWRRSSTPLGPASCSRCGGFERLLQASGPVPTVSWNRRCSNPEPALGGRAQW